MHSKDASGPNAAFMSYPFHKVYELVQGISLEESFVEFWQFTQKLRQDLRNTLNTDLDV